VVTNNFLVSIGIIVGACGVALMGMSLQVKAGEFYNLATYALIMLNQTPLVTYIGYGTLGVGFLSIVVGAFIGATGLFARSTPILAYVGLVLLVGVGSASLAGGIIVANAVQTMDDAIYKQTGKVPEVGKFISNAVHFQLAMFNGCCASTGQTKEQFVSVPNDYSSTDGFVPACETIPTAVVPNYFGVTSKISCYRDQETYRIYNFTVSQNLPRICQTLTDAYANIGGKTIPGTSIDVTAITNGQKIIPIVGNVNDPFYGCGTGYAKAFQAAMLIWVENVLTPVATALLAIGILQLFLVLLGVVANYSSGKQKETAEEAYAKYMEHVALGAAGLQQQQQEYDIPNPVYDQQRNQANNFPGNQGGYAQNNYPVQGSPFPGTYPQGQAQYQQQYQVAQQQYPVAQAIPYGNNRNIQATQNMGAQGSNRTPRGFNVDDKI
jgi:hypothetical protein